MAAQNLSRKRAAPGVDPMGYSQPPAPSVSTFSNGLGPDLSNDQFLQWGQAAQSQNGFQDPSMYDSNSQQSSYPTNSVTASNQIARRPINNQIATRINPSGGHWMQEPNSAASSGASPAWEDDIEDLEQKAQIAKRDAQSKRKAIPPFVLKLRSFLDDGKNGDLIRWTDDGKSFVVLDEDEFAKKLIPELFKHNNYASFVRQLNMYGFHKKVGLSDNSMRASERKSKSPSEYSNPYFREGHYDLMWLIQKPKNVTTTTKSKGRPKQEDEANDAVEDTHEEFPTDTRVRPRPQLTLPENSSTLSTEALQSVQRELVAIRQQQAQISKMMNSIKREHEQLYGQAATFQDQHTRHENSINAILTFLATVYHKGLSGQDSAGIANFLGGSIPQANTAANVVDVGDYNFDQFPAMGSVNNNRPLKRQPLLLTDGQTRPQTMSSRQSNSPQVRNSRFPSRMAQASQSPATGQVDELPDLGSSVGSPSSTIMNGQPQQDMMSVIQNTNARNPSPSTPVADFTNVLNDLEKSRGNTPLSSTQRENMLRMINNSANQTGDNALINVTPPSGPTNFDRKLASTSADLDALARMQAQQDQSVEKLTNLLQPLSPSGSIPGIGDGQSLPPPPIDIEDFLNHNDYFAMDPLSGDNGTGDPYDFNTDGVPRDNSFDWDDANNDDDELFKDVGTTNNGHSDDADMFAGQPFDFRSDPTEVNAGIRGGRVESVASSEVTTPKHSSIDPGVGSEFDDEGDTAGPHTRSKGRKMSSFEDDGAAKKRRRP